MPLAGGGWVGEGHWWPVHFNETSQDGPKNFPTLLSCAGESAGRSENIPFFITAQRRRKESINSTTKIRECVLIATIKLQQMQWEFRIESKNSC